MYKILKEKGYKGKNNIEEILNWLISLGIYIGFDLNFKENIFQGYSAKIICPPFDSEYNTNLYKNYRDTLEACIYLLKDYIPKQC